MYKIGLASDSNEKSYLPMNRLLTALFFIVFFLMTARGQDLSNLKKEKPLKLSSGFSLSSGFYHTNQTDGRQAPTNWVLSGSPTVTFYGISMPFSFVISNQNRSFHQPFNRYGIAPSYKWIKLYAGWNSMNFSQYTLASRQFFGTGIELTPRGFRFGAMYGRFQKAIREDSLAVQGNSFVSNIPTPAFERRGYAFKVGFGVTKNHFDIIFMKAADAINSIPPPVKKELLPQENAGLGLKWQFTFFKKLTWKADAALSAFTRNQNSDTISLENVRFRSVIQNILIPKTSTQGFLAGDMSLGFRQKQFNIEVRYKRIDPGFRSMGAYYFQTDLTQYSVAPSFPIGKSLRFSGNVGWQEDNLYKKKAATTHRFIGMGNMSFNPPKSKFGCDLNYTNFGLSQAPGVRSLNDSTRIQQVNQSLNFSPRLQFNNDAHTQTLFLTLGLNDLADRNPNITYQTNSRAMNANLGYNLALTSSLWNFNGNMTVNRVKIKAGSTQSLGFGGGAGKGFLENKLNANVNTGWYANSFNGKSNGWSLTAGFGGSYQVRKNQSATMSLNFLNNKSKDVSVSRSFREWFGNIAYSVSF
jgi:hypothetical protein